MELKIKHLRKQFKDKNAVNMPNIVYISEAINI